MKQLLSVIALTFSSLLGAQTIYYVSPIGSDLALGDVFNPFQTINHALGIASPGTTVILMGGSYSELIHMPSGALGNPITLTNYNTHVATLRSPLGNTDAIISITDAPFITI